MPYKNFHKALLFSRNQVFCLKNWKLWQSPTIIEFNIFCLNFAHVSFLPMSGKGCLGRFKFCLDLQLFAKITKYLVSTHSFFTFLRLHFLDFNKIKKITKRLFLDIVKWETRAKFEQNILNFMIIGACQSFKFFRQKAWFLGNKRALSKFRYQILHNLISITKL